MQKTYYEICTMKKDTDTIIVSKYEYRKGVLRYKSCSDSFDLNTMAAIAYNLHILDKELLPTHFSQNVTHLMKNAIYIGDFKFLDTKIFTSLMCVVGFDFIFDTIKCKTVVGFYIPDITPDHICGDLESNPNKSLVFAKIIDTFYRCIDTTINKIISQTTKKLSKCAPIDYAKKSCNFKPLDDFITIYPIVILPNEKLQYKYPIIEKIMHTKYPEKKLPSIFAHIIATYDLHINPEMYVAIVKFVIANENAYVDKLLLEHNIVRSSGFIMF
jgi:hypothetical protein